MKTMKEIVSVSELLNQNKIKERIQKVLKDNSEVFITSVIQISNTKTLKDCDGMSIINASITAATLNLPINDSLGYAYIVPYNVKNGNSYLKYAQFQIGWKGLVQLALRTEKYARINTAIVYENQFKSYNSLYELLDADFSIEGEGNPIGYVAYFKLTNGFEKTSYWRTEQIIAHASEYSKTFGKNDYSTWNNPYEFDKMACKTVLKSLLSKYGILSSELTKAIESDQSVQIDEGKYLYLDNESVNEDGNTSFVSSDSDLGYYLTSIKNDFKENELNFGDDIEGLKNYKITLLNSANQLYNDNEKEFKKSLPLLVELGELKKILE